MEHPLWEPEKMPTNKVRIYLSHSIRGVKGADATDEDMRSNNLRATNFGIQLRAIFPDIDFYVPGDGDEFVMIAYRKKYLDENKILDVDCEIVDACNAILVFAPDQFVSNGMMVEIQHANATHKPVLLIKNLEQANRAILNYLEGLKR
jgi:hypothetical protein